MKCRVRHVAAGCSDAGRVNVRVFRKFTITGIAALVAVALSGAGSAQASTVTVGSVFPPGSTPTPFGQVQTFFNAALPEKGVNLVSPTNGAIVRWRVKDAEGGPFRLRVLRPNGSGAYTAVGTSNPAMPSGPGLQTFTANLSIRAGDLIGVDPSNDTDKIGVVEVPGASYGFIFPPPFDSATVAPSGSAAGKEIALSAEVQPTPVVTSVSPSFGWVTGGASVTITGTNFTAASAVKFGSTPATGFTIDSEDRIIATAPPSATVGPVDVTVTTLAGTSGTNHNSRFSYQGCVVPKLKGKQVKGAKRALRQANCKVDTIKRRKGKQGKVLKQRPKPNKTLAPGTKVNLTVGR